MEVDISQISNEGEHPSIYEDGGKDGDHTCIDCSVEDDPKDYY